jgi:cell wall assembly regulator SMI1
MVLRRRRIDQFASTNNFEASMPLDRKASNQCNHKAEQVRKSDSKFPNEVKNIHKK